MPPHCGKNGPCLPSALPGVDEIVAPGWLAPELEHAAIAGVKATRADAANTSVVTLRRTAYLFSCRSQHAL